METSKLNETFIPKQIIKKTVISNQNAILQTNQFQKTAGNAYIQFDPVQVKFSGYELGKAQSAIVKVINKSPIPQRIHVLPPTQPGFTIKVNKKGPIAAGMSENIQINFISDVYKYQYDVVKINSQTGNFVVPVYAYPSIPKIHQIFPKIIDFGQVPINQSTSNIYPINNPIPMDFTYEFAYLQQSPAFIITPIRGIISSSSTENIQITFIPSDKKTFVAQIILNIKQFDFQPIKIKMMGTGKQKKQGLHSTIRVKSSKLNPLVKAQSNKLVDAPIQQESQIKAIDPTGIIQKKTFIRSKASFPKLLKKASVLNNQSLAMTQVDKLQTTVKKQNERDFNSQFSKIQELDKQKEIKFSQFLGDRAMNQEQLQFQQKIISQTKRNRLQNFKDFCTNKHQNQLRSDGQVDLTKFVPKNVTWDINKNDQLKLRKQKLQIFMRAGTRIIKKYRLTKRLQKIQQFLSDCKTKEDVRKKVQQDYAKSLDLSKQNIKLSNQKFTFSLQMLAGTSFPIQFKDETQSIKKVFETEGSPKFDDDKPLDEVKLHQFQLLNYSNLNYPSDFIYAAKIIPSSRKSAQQEYPLKTAALPNYQMVKPSLVYNLPLKVPIHQFIYNSFELSRYKTSNPIDQKDPQYLIDATVQNIQDEFQGWSKGDMNVLKAKFQRNMGCQYQSISLFNYPQTGDVGFISQFGAHLPKQIGNLQITKDDTIQQGDSDQQKVNNIQTEKTENYIAKIEEKNSKVKERRQKNVVENFEKQLLAKIQKNIQNIKLTNITKAIDKISSYNKWTQQKKNKVLI